MAVTTSKRVATVYAEALLGAAIAGNVQEAVRADVESLRQLLVAEPGFAKLLTTPDIDVEQREQIIRRILQDWMSGLTLNFLLVLSRRWRLAQLAGILDQYVRLDNERQGRREVEVIVTEQLDERMLSAITDAIVRWADFEPVVKVRQDPALLGGLVIRVGDQQIDASVAGRLHRLRGRLKGKFAESFAASLREAEQG